MPNAKLTREQRNVIAAKWVGGETRKGIAEEFDICENTVVRVCRDLRASRKGLKPANVVDMKKFKERVHSILWRQGSGDGHKEYKSWEDRVAELESKDGGNMRKNEAVVRASKEYPSLTRLFSEYDVREHDPNPESHPQIQYFGEAVKNVPECDGIEQTFRESLRWALAAAGAQARTGKEPETCPCEAAWYLYKQAYSDPKDFLARSGQAEAKGDTESEEKKNVRLAGARSISEIDGMLAELEIEEENEDE